MAPPNPDRSGVPDAEIVRLVREGETDAFAELVRRTHRPAYRLAFRIAQNHQDADDVLQESYVKAYRALHLFAPSRAFGPWMLTIVGRTALGPSPRAARLASAPPDAAEGVERAFAGLAEEHRAIIALRVEGDLAYAEIADVLGLPAQTVMSRLARAREALLEESRKVERGKGTAPMKDEALHPPRASLFAYRDGELPAERRVVLEAHVVSCSACRALIDDVSGIEAALKRTPHDTAADYYEKLTGAVLGRLAGNVSEEERPPVLAKHEAAAIERRRSEDDPRREDSGRIGARPRLPWAAIVATASAAAAVLVVVVLLARYGAVRRAISPQEPVAPRQETPVGTAEVAAPSDSAASAPKPSPKPASPPAPVPAPKPVSPPAPVPSSSSPPVPSPKAIPPSQPRASGAYGALLSRFGLPPVWAESVPAEALERAEPELRYLYQVGRADSDSARVRLYLAEAARLRYVPGRDTTLYYRIVRHYRRAIRLQGPDSDVGRIARDRLGTLQP